MPSPAEVRQVVEKVCGTKGDDTVFEYVVSILEDGEFELGPNGEDAFEAFGAVLVCVTPLIVLCLPHMPPLALPALPLAETWISESVVKAAVKMIYEWSESIHDGFDMAVQLNSYKMLPLRVLCFV